MSKTLSYRIKGLACGLEAFLYLSLTFTAVGGAQALPAQRDLNNASLEDLMDIQVTSVSKREESLSNTDTALFVITQEDIRHSGAGDIPDLLRIVPGVNVALIDANTYAVSIRGFNDRLADKVLVLIDGRTVYTPTTSGVYWDQLDVPLEDIDRIEVIRGPGGTVWGANAVNGVINIITKRADDTKGGLVRAGGGSRGAADGLVQYGGQMGRAGSYRLFENYSNVGNLVSPAGSPAADGFHLFHTGFRSDWVFSRQDSATVQGDLMETREGQTISVVLANALPAMKTFNDRITVGEGNALGRWDHVFRDGSDSSLQIYYDRYNRYDEGVSEVLNTVDVDFQHHRRAGLRNDIVWGFGYRFTGDEHLAGYGKSYVPLNQTNHLFSAFAQDELQITPAIHVTFGTKLEHQPYTGLVYEPSVQLSWTPELHHTFWMSAAQAMRVVSREDTSLWLDPFTVVFPDGSFAVAEGRSRPGPQPERLRDVEAGYRVELTKQFSVDLSVFSSYYHDLGTVDALPPFFTTEGGPPHVALPSLHGNSMNARSYGGEFSANWNVTRRWRLNLGYSGVHIQVLPHPGSNDTSESARVANTPQNQVQVRSQIKLLRNIEWDSAMYYSGGLRESGNGPVPAYVRVDTRLGRRFGEYFDLSIVGQNLATPRHAEFHNAFEVRSTLAERSIFAKLSCHF